MINNRIITIACTLGIAFIIGLYFFAQNENFWVNIISTLIGVLGALLIFYIGLHIDEKQKNEIKTRN